MTDDPVDAKSRDAFGRQVSLTIQNQADLASHYPYSPERYRLFVDGSRQFIQYSGSPSQFEDTTDSFKLKPQSDGETVQFVTNEQYRYAVQYVVEWSLAFQTNQSLQSGDYVIVGFGDTDLNNSSDDSPGPAADGWFMEWDSSLDDDETRLSQYRDGTQQDATVVTTEKAITDWVRYAAETNWYSVGATRYQETFTGGGVQRNPELGGVSNDSGKGPLTGNKQVEAAIKTGSSGAGSLELEVGSIGVRNFGEIEAIVRRKTYRWSADIDATGEYVALDAIRLDPDNDIVNVQLANLTVLEYDVDDDVKILALAFDQSKLKDSGGNDIVDGDFSVPAEISAQNSVVQTTSAVDQFPDSSGTIQTDGQAADPGGHQEGYGALHTSGQGSGTQRGESNAQTEAKRPISERDIVVFLGLSDTTGTVTVDITAEEQW